MFERGTEGSSTIWENQTGGRKNMAEAALASSAKNKTEELQMYLKDVYTVEKERYCLERAVSKMEETIKCECVKPASKRPGEYGKWLVICHRYIWRCELFYIRFWLFSLGLAP